MVGFGVGFFPPEENGEQLQPNAEAVGALEGVWEHRRAAGQPPPLPGGASPEDLRKLFRLPDPRPAVHGAASRLVSPVACPFAPSPPPRRPPSPSTFCGARRRRCTPASWVARGMSSRNVYSGGRVGSGKLVLLKGSVSSSSCTRHTSVAMAHPSTAAAGRGRAGGGAGTHRSPPPAAPLSPPPCFALPCLARPLRVTDAEALPSRPQPSPGSPSLRAAPATPHNPRASGRRPMAPFPAGIY